MEGGVVFLPRPPFCFDVRARRIGFVWQKKHKVFLPYKSKIAP